MTDSVGGKASWKRSEISLLKHRFVHLYILLYPDMRSMYGIFTCIYHTNQLNGGKYAIHGSYRIYIYIYILYLSIL